MAITLSKIFKAAHLNAKKLRERFASYREAFRFALCRVWENAKRMIEDAKYSDEVKEAAKMIKTAHHFEGRSRKVESKISWKLDQMLSTYADKQAAREYAEILERREALDPRNFFSPSDPRRETRIKERTKMNIGPENFTDAELEAMPRSELEKLHESCRSWMNALKICPEFWEYSALSGRIEAIWDRQYEAYVREYRNPDGTWRDPR